jgi:hypothetical protein
MKGYYSYIQIILLCNPLRKDFMKLFLDGEIFLGFIVLNLC